MIHIAHTHLCIQVCMSQRAITLVHLTNPTLGWFSFQADPSFRGWCDEQNDIWLRKYMYGWKASVTIFSSWGVQVSKGTHTHTKARTQHINPLHNIHKYIELLCAFFITTACSSFFSALFPLSLLPFFPIVMDQPSPSTHNTSPHLQQNQMKGASAY